MDCCTRNKQAEYLHIDLADQNVLLTVQSPTTGTATIRAKFENTYDVVRAAVNVKF